MEYNEDGSIKITQRHKREKWDHTPKVTPVPVVEEVVAEVAAPDSNQANEEAV